MLVPLDPVHDVRLKLVTRALQQAGHNTVLLEPDLSVDELVRLVIEHEVDR